MRKSKSNLEENRYFFELMRYKYDYKNKDVNINNYIRYMLNRTNAMFEYENLPDTMNADILELQLQTNGTAVIYKHDGKLYSFIAGLGGERDVYYRPTLAVITNPYLKLSTNAVIDKDCVVMHNDSTWTGLMPLYSKYANLLTETDITIFIQNINNRIQTIMSTNDINTKDSAEIFLKKIAEGEQGIILEDGMFETFRTNDFIKHNSSVHELIELKQYISSQWFIDIGLSSSYNMKSQYLNYSETSIDNDILTPLVDDMLKNRKQDIEKVNKMFGTNITVELSSAWRTNQKEIEEFENSDSPDETENPDTPNEEDLSDNRKKEDIEKGDTNVNEKDNK